MALTGRTATLLGLGTACWMLNPVSVLLLAFGSFVRWAVVAHHVCHKGYDRVPEVPRRFQGRIFARGSRRWFDWLDWMHPDAWHHEHDILHHYKLGERDGDPDVPEDNAWWLRTSRIPMPLRVVIVLLGSLVWKPLYYAPNTMRMLFNHEDRRGDAEPLKLYDWRLWSPFQRRFWVVVARCWLPYSAWRFGVLPALFLPLGTAAWANVLATLLVAELVTNFWSFWVIVPNHAGDDLYRFETPIQDKSEFYVRQVVGSVDYRCGGDLNDLLHGWLNYQIEHHVFPDMTLRQYQRLHPRLKALCEQHGVPFRQESIFRRSIRTLDVLIGRATMPVWTPVREH